MHLVEWVKRGENEHGLNVFVCLVLDQVFYIARI